jgi:hypothetical protein
LSAADTEVESIEPISPELVLIDPELAARVRSLVPLPPGAVVTQIHPTPTLEQREAHQPSKRRAYLAIAWAAAVLSPVAAFASIRPSPDSGLTIAGEPFALDRSVERIVPSAVPGAVAAHPGLRAVIDPATGLVWSRTAITCRVRYVGAFWCTLRPPRGGRVTIPVRGTAARIAIMHG